MMFVSKCILRQRTQTVKTQERSSAASEVYKRQARENGSSKILFLTWLREWRSMKSIFKLDADTKSEEIERSRSLPQGDPAAPCLFNITLDLALIHISEPTSQAENSYDVCRMKKKKL